MRPTVGQHLGDLGGSRAVGTFDGQDGIYLSYPLVPINGFIIGKCAPIPIKS